MTTLTAPHLVMGRLEGIESDLGERQNEYEQAAHDKASLTRDWDRRLAIARVNAKGNDAEARKAAALVTAIEQDDLYDRLKDAEARFEACRVVVRLLETKASIGQSILRAQSR